MQTFTMTPDEFAHRAERLRREGGPAITSNAGQIDSMGVTVHYDYNGKDTLTVEVVHKPFYLATSMIEGRISDWFRAA